MIKAILFDLDGTLINTNNLILQTFKYIFKTHLNIEVKDEDIVKCFGEPLIITMERYDKGKADFLVERYREENERLHDELAEEFKGVKEALVKLKAMNIKIGIVTSKRRAMAERGLKLFELMNFMDVIITPEDTKLHKPNGEPVLKACEKLGIKAEQAIMVGDSHNDILSGKNANCKTCLVTYTALPMDDLLELKPDYVVNDIIELIQAI